MTTVDLSPGAEGDFEAALAAEQPRLSGETLWYRLVAGGRAPRYLRLRPRASVSAILDGRSEGTLPERLRGRVSNATVEILNLKPAMSYRLPEAR
jgi:hypothetical protein